MTGSTMSKKHLKRLKELQRLQALHQGASTSSPRENILDQPIGEEPVTSPVPPPVTVAVVADDPHTVIKRDLVGLLVLIGAMLVSLVGLNWLIDNTALSQWIIKIAGFVTN